jgi:hypothetical protein
MYLCVVAKQISIELIRSFAVFCTSNLNLKQSTTKSYMSSLRLAHALQGIECKNFECDKILNMIYSGAKTVQSSKVTTVDRRRAMSLPLLLVLAHRIQTKNWNHYSKQVVWAVAAIAFFGSIRKGEMLSPTKEHNCNNVCLTWSDVKFINDDELLLRIPFSKTKKLQGEYVDIFSFKYHDCCPMSPLSI